MEIRKEEIIELEQKLIKGISASDIQFLNDILHDDLLFIAPNGNVITKEMDLTSHKSGEMEVKKIIPIIEAINIIDDCAIVVIVYDTKGKMLGNPIQGRFRYIRIWKRFNDGFKVIAGSCFDIE
jgi:ketosteroid isomerase-like protein